MSMVAARRPRYQPEIFIRLKLEESLTLDDVRFAEFVRGGGRLRFEDAPIKVRLRACREEMRRLLATEGVAASALLQRHTA